jgi:signal recognition particle receptor subunit beta
MSVVNLASPSGEIKIAAAEPNGEPATGTASKWQTEPVGLPLEEIRKELLGLGRDLAANIPESGAAFVRDASRVLENLVCRIAVIGHVRSGKSSFINALVQRPGLLPVDVSPWSTAVTRLHFGWAGAPAGTAAEFQLFEQDEWDKLARGTTRVRELTQQLVPGFEAELLARHVTAMRQRAEQRLGGRLASLLGARHTHEAFSPQILARYISPASAFEPGEGGAGELSELTRAADLYFAAAPFCFPLTFIEAPGLDDPFLVRDELTRQTLESADLHIYLLDARQPLTSTDLAHLRMLRGLFKERIVVFINRIDEFADLVNQTKQVADHVRQVLEREFPAADIPVIAGSAAWGNAALTAERLDARRALTPALVAYAKHKGALRPVEIKGGEGEGTPGDLSKGQLGRALSACSGFPEVCAALNRLLPRSHPAHLIKQVAAYFTELAQLNESALREEHSRKAAAVEAQNADNAAREQELQRIQSDLGCIRQIAAEVERRLSSLQATITDIVLEHRNGLHDTLMKAFDSFAQAEAEKLLDAVGSGRVGRQWRCDTRPLRDRIDEELKAALLRAEGRLRATEHNVFPLLREAMLRAFPDLDLPAAGLAAEQPVMVMAAPLPESIVLDGGRGFWPLGRSRSIASEQPDQELERALREEFIPTIEQLIRSANTRMQRYAQELSELATRTSVAVMDTLRRESDGLIARAATLLDAREQHVKTAEAFAGELAEQYNRLSEAQALAERLGQLSGRCNELVT